MAYKKKTDREYKKLLDAIALPEREVTAITIASREKLWDLYYEQKKRRGRSPDARPVLPPDGVPTYENGHDPKNIASGKVGAVRRTLADLEARR